MNIWLINHYAVPTKYYPLARPATFAKYLQRMGHTVTIFAASTVHNSDKNLITDNQKWRDDYVDGIHYVYIRCQDYQGNGLKRVLNMCEFAVKLPKVCNHYEKPNAIIATSMPPVSCAVGIHLAKKYNIKGIAEIADLWPESIVAYGVSSRRNPIIKLLYCLEKWIYKASDSIVFTMEGGKDYIIDKKWDTEHGGLVDLKKVHHINNGVDLELFSYNKATFKVDNQDLEDQDIFKVIYTGSVRKVNDLSILVGAAREIKRKGFDRIKIYVFGDGDEKEKLEEEVKQQGLNNIIFKGSIPKHCVPFVLSKADLCLLHWKPTPITKFGMSMNKTFEYFAAGKPILSNSVSGYDLIQKYQCGVAQDINTAEQYADNIIKLSNCSKEEYETYCHNSRIAAKEFDYSILTTKLIKIVGE